MSEPVSLAGRRAAAMGDCRKWTVLDALKAAVRDIEAGTMEAEMVYVAIKSPPDERGAWRRHFYAAGGTNLELSGLLAHHLHATCRDD